MDDKHESLVNAAVEVCESWITSTLRGDCNDAGMIADLQAEPVFAAVVACHAVKVTARTVCELALAPSDELTQAARSGDLPADRVTKLGLRLWQEFLLRKAAGEANS